MTHLIYGKSVGMVERGCDVDGLISEWHHVFTLGGLVATLPWLIHPIITNPWLKRFLMPSKLHSTGSGHIMSVSQASCPLQSFESDAQMADTHFSGTKKCSNIVWKILSWLVRATWLIGQ